MRTNTGEPVVQRVQSILLGGEKKLKTFTVSQAAKLVAKNLPDGYDVDWTTIEALLISYQGSSNFASMDDLVDLVMTLLPPAAQVDADDDVDSSSSEQDDDRPAKEFIRSINSTLGDEAETDLLEFYLGQLELVMRRLRAGAVGIRYLTLTPEQRTTVLHRLIQAMVALGNSQPHPREFFEKNTVILHGSYLFGAAQDKPGDIDIIISGKQEIGKSVGIAGRLDREPQEDKFSVGSRYGLLDFMGGIPFSEAEDKADLADDSAQELYEHVARDLDGYITAADDEKDAGKKWRKYINIAVAIHYLLERLNQQSPLGGLIASANAAIVRGAPPKAADLVGPVKTAMNLLKAAIE